MTQAAFTNARIVTPDEVVHGTVEVAGGVISSLREGGRASGPDVDFGGDYLLPGLVELHTDTLERHFVPRPRVQWPGTAAVFAHDGQLAAAGITTVFDALSVGIVRQGDVRSRMLGAMTSALRTARDTGVLRVSHFLHLRCELSCAGLMDLFAPFTGDPLVRLVSLMDHTPGQRQFVDRDRHRAYYQKTYGLDDAEFAAFLETKQRDHVTYSGRHRAELVGLLEGTGITLASHDDATVGHVEEAARYGVAIAEFPTTVEAASAARDRGLTILAGAPNLVLGGSHSGNVSALELASLGLLDVLSSDYVPASSLHGVFLLHRSEPFLSLPQAVALSTMNPARAVGLADRGAIRPGARADLIRVREIEGVPVVLETWREGRRVM